MGKGQVGNVHILRGELVQEHDAGGGGDQVLMSQDDALNRKAIRVILKFKEYMYIIESDRLKIGLVIQSKLKLKSGLY